MSAYNIVSIAGSDPSGGAGIQADLKAFSAHGAFGMTVVAALTAQSTRGVAGVHPVPAAFVTLQMDTLFSDATVHAVKVGMLGTAEVTEAVAEAIDRHALPHVVLDPVMVATSGSVLADEATVAAFEALMQQATLTTPNVPELAAFGGPDAMAERGVAYLAKGGDAEGPVVEDRLVRQGTEDVVWRSPRIDTRHTHGTGCTLSSAIATYLGMGHELPDAIDRAREFVRATLLAAPGFGAGHGPMGHQAVR